MLDYYLKSKSAHNISYDATSSTDIFYHKCIIVLTQKKSINHSFCVWIYWNQVNQLWVKIIDYWNFKNNCSIIQSWFTALVVILANYNCHDILTVAEMSTNFLNSLISEGRQFQLSQTRWLKIFFCNICQRKSMTLGSM